MGRFIISGGGTGGHVYPAIAIAQALRQRDPGAEILFVGARGRLEMDKVPAAGFDITGLPVTGFVRRLTWKNLAFPFLLMGSLRKARQVVSQFQPDVVIGVGGYASGPTLWVSAGMGIPTLIQEQNSYPGLTNRLLAKRASAVCVAYGGMERYFPPEKIILTGNPVRSDLLALPDRLSEEVMQLGLDPSLKTFLVIGGSGGARTINESVLALLEKGLPEGTEILWQTGPYYYEEVCRKVRDTRCPVSIQPFLDRMDLAYAMADLVVSRAGAIAISELCVVGKAVILVPSPNVAGDHQTKNARALADKGAAVVIPDREAVERLPGEVIRLLKQDALRASLGENIHTLAVADGAGRIAREAVKLAGYTGGEHA